MQVNVNKHKMIRFVCFPDRLLPTFIHHVDEELNMDEDVHTFLDRKQLSKNRTLFILRLIKTDTESLPNPPWLGGTDTDEDDGEGAETLHQWSPNID